MKVDRLFRAELRAAGAQAEAVVREPEGAAVQSAVQCGPDGLHDGERAGAFRYLSLATSPQTNTIYIIYIIYINLTTT